MNNSGIPYFPLDCQLDEKFELIEAEFGLTGFAVVVKLFQRIYGMQGYYCEWTNEVALLFGKNIGLGRNVVSEIISAAVKRGIFDKDIFEKYQVLTSRGIQERYFKIVKRRNNVKINQDYLLVQCALLPKSVDISSENVNINKRNVYISEQRKEEKRRVKESRVKESKEKHAPHVFLSKTDYQFLIDNYGETVSKRMIEILNDYKEAKGVKYESDIAAIRKWVISAYQEEQAKKPIKDKQSYDIDDLDSLAINMRGVNK